MTPANPSLRRKPLVLAACLVLVVILCWQFPLFHVVSLKKAQDQRQAAQFNAQAFVQEFWDDTLLPATRNASEIEEVTAALAQDQAAARKRYGRVFGISTATLFFVKGSGKVVSMENDSVRILADGGPEGIFLDLPTGMVFGNTVRDGTGLLDINDYPNSQDFNDISAQLNAVVEKRLGPELREKAAVGRALHFVGCFELQEDANLKELQLIPIKVDWP